MEKGRQAVELSQQALYNYELVPQLYFGTDQLLATLAPLLFPIALPVLLNVFRETKYNMKKKSKD